MTQTHPVRSLGLIALALLSPLLVACGGADDEPAAAASSSRASTSSAAPTRTLLETCPEIEVALSAADSELGTAEDLRGVAQSLGDLYDAGDTESRNALQLIVDPLAGLIDVRERDAVGMELINALDSYEGAIGAIANRCAAVGSSALQ